MDRKETPVIHFPSTEWFLALKTLMEEDPERYRRLGTVDVVLVAKIDGPHASELYEITFRGYRCIGVRALPSLTEASPGAVVLEGNLETWREMIAAIGKNGKADLPHTLNTLTLADVPMRVTADNQLDVDRFYRYQETLQEFFDEAAAVATDLDAVETAMV
jgi:hypothetical protein